MTARLDGVLQALVDWLSIGLVHGTALALLTALATATLLRRARPALLSVLWTIVLVKFLVPFGPGAEMSLSSALDRVLAAEAPAVVAGDQGLLSSAPFATVEEARLDLATLLAIGLYMVGVLWIAGRRWARRRALGRQVERLPRAGAALTSRVAAAARSVGLTRTPAVHVDADAAGPYLVGRVRPRLVLPAWLEPAAPAWSAAVAHELAHLRRRDPLLGALEAAATLAFWFWPPVRWACRRLDRAREMACDQWAIAHGPLGARDYARFLVAVATRRAGGVATSTAGTVALLRTRGQLAERVDHLLGGARPASLGRRPAAAVAAWSMLCLAGAAGAEPAAPAGALLCAIEPDLIAQILASNPDADADRDGVLSQDEACAHQLRMKQRLIDHVVDAEMVSRLDPAADVNGDGSFSPAEVDLVKDQIDLGLSEAEVVVLEYGDGASVPLSDRSLRVAAARAPAALCPSDRCSERPVRRMPLLIDVSSSTQESIP